MITLALVGAGAWGKNYIKTINSLSNCRLPHEYIKTKDYRKLLDHKDIGGVIIATPSSTHFSIARDFLEKGFNVLVEKPLTTDYKKAKFLNLLAKKSKSITMVGHVFLYHPAIIEMRKAIKKMHPIRYIMSEGTDYGPIRSDVSSLWDWAPHEVSVVLHLLGEKPISVSAWAINSLRPKTHLYDMCFLNLTFAGGVHFFTRMGWLSPVKKRNMVVVGEKNSLVFDDTQKKKLRYIRNTEEKQETFISHSPDLPLTRQILEFVNSIKTKKTPLTNFAESLSVIKIIEGAEKSIRNNGKEIKLKD